MRKILKNLLLGSIILVPFSPETQVTSAIRMSLPVEIILPILSLLALVYWAKDWKQRTPKITLANIAVFSFLGIVGLSCLFSVVPTNSIKALAILGMYCFAFYFVPQIIRFTKVEWKQLWNVYLIVLGTALIYALIKYLSIGIGYSESYRFAEPFSVGHTLFMAIGFPAFLLVVDEQIQSKKLDWRTPIALLYLVFMVISYSRFYWVVLLLYGFLFLFWYFKKLRIWLIASVLVVGVSSVFIYKKIDKERNERKAWLSPEDHKSVFRQITGIFKMDYNESNRERINRLKIGVKMYQENPINGLGYNTYADKYPEYAKQTNVDITSKAENRMNAHILYIGWLVELGILGIISGLFLMAAFMITAFRLRKTPYGFVLLLIAINYFLLGVIEDYFLLETIIPGFWLSYSFANSIEK